MSYLHSFGPNDILTNRMVTRPNYEFIMYSGSIYLNKERGLGQNIPTGSLSLYEYNVDRDGTTQLLIKPFVIKSGNWLTIGDLTGTLYAEHDSEEPVTGSYPLTSSITRQYFGARTSPPNFLGSPQSRREQLDVYSNARKELLALQNTMNHYRFISNKYHYTGSYVSGAVNLLQIPSIFFDNGIEKGSVNLKFYYTGSLIGEASDSQKNGELISTVGGASGSTVGMVLYNEGFILLTSSLSISTDTDMYAVDAAQASEPTWLDFGAYGTYASASLYSLNFNGTQKVPIMTMFASAQPGELNNSLNPTWISSSHSDWKDKTSVSPEGYIEPKKTLIKNTVQSQYCAYEDEFQKQVFITEIGIFDEDKNLLGIAKLANPVLKKESDSYTFKLNLDM